jgi:hypothetical protein
MRYANIMSTLAVFVALGGSSYAAINVTGKQIKDNTVTGRDVRNGSVGSKDVRDSSLLSRDFKPGQLPAGPQGPAGAQGPPGAPGISGLTVVSGETAFNSSSSKTATATCPIGKQVIGAGYEAVAVGGIVVESIRFPSSSSVAIDAWETPGYDLDWKVIAHAKCAYVAP